MEIKLAVNTPLRRRLQMLTVVMHSILIPLSLSCFFSFCAFPLFWPLLLLYLVFMALDGRANRGSPLSPYERWFRESQWWRWFAAYYPITLHKTVNLEPCFAVDPKVLAASKSITDTPSNLQDGRKPFWKRLLHLPLVTVQWWFYYLIGKKDHLAKPTGKRYLFGYHPHGIISMGAVGGVATDGAGWSKLFPGIPVRLLTIPNNFLLPLYREYLLSMGISSVSKKSCLNHLRNNIPICIVIGGAPESVLAEPGTMDLYLASRFGFAKIALQTGASLVPVIGFGETDIYEQARPKGSFLKKIHHFMITKFEFTIPLFHARGIFNYQYGLMPYRLPINVVVGEPIDCPEVKDPSNELVQEYRDKYIASLKKLFNENRHKYWKNHPNSQLRIVDEPATK